MRVDVPVVTIGGRKIPVYSVSFSNGGSTQPSTMTIKYINKNGQYDWPDLSSQSLVTIRIGDVYTFHGYVVTAEKSEDQQGKYITVHYVDNSIILDSTFVGLRGIHGAGGKTEVLGGSSYRNTILVGSEVDPCKDLEETHADPCAPPSSSNSIVEDNLKKIIDCAEQRLIKILDVVYSFNELLSALSSQQVLLRNIPAEKLHYFARHTGSLREVLNAWCQEYGITFFWENGVNFVDLKRGIEINDTIDGSTCRILDKREVKSIANNYAQANINYFGLDGQIKEYTSQLNGGTRLTLLPITLSDIFRNQSNGALNPFIQKYYGSIEVLQKCCVLSKYSPKFRDLYLMYHHYNAVDRESAENVKKMPLLGVEILNTITTQGTDQGFIAVYLNQFIPILLGTPEAPKPTHYAARCFYNEEVHNKFIEMERYLANEFIGRYWIRSFNKRGYSFSAPGGSVEFLENPTAANFDFASKIPKTVLVLNSFLRSLFDTSATTGSTDFFRGGIVLLERSSPWQPEGSEIQFVSTSEALEKNHFNAINDILSDVPDAGLWGENYSFKAIGNRQPVIKIFSNEFGNLNLEGHSTGNHPLDSDNVNIPVDLGGFTSSYGLVSAVCKAYTLTLDSNKVFIYMPVQSHDTYGNQFPGFVITAEKDGASDYKILVNKIQRVLADFPKNSDEWKNSIGLRVNFRDATQYINKVLTSEGNSCQYDEAEIEELLRVFAAKFSFPAPVVEQKIFYSIGGAPATNITLVDGLSSFSIVLDGVGGLISEIEYSNIPKTQTSESIRLKDFERLTNANYNKSFFSSDNKEIIS